MALVIKWESPMFKPTISTVIALAAFGSMPAQAAEWFVGVSAQSSALGTTQTFGSEVKCSGTNASTNYCGSNAIIGNQTYLHARSTSTVLGSPNDTIYKYQHGDAFASADLASGKLRLTDYAESEGLRSEGTRASASAQFRETLTFSSASQNPFSVTVKVHVDGLFEGYQQPRFGFALNGTGADLGLSVGWADASDGAPSCVGPIAGCTLPAEFIIFQRGSGWTQFGPSDFIGSFLIDPSRPEFLLGMNLSAGGSTSNNAGGIVSTYSQFGNTASVQFELPEGVTFTSTSGVFLTAIDATAGVPEPATWAMLIAGFGLVGGAMRRRGRLALA